MSLINKMLQDLDARGSHPGGALQGEIKPVAMPERRLAVLPLAWIASGLGLLVLLVGLVWWFKRPAPTPVSAGKVAPVLAATPAVVAPPVAPPVVAVPAASSPAPVPKIAAVAPKPPLPAAVPLPAPVAPPVAKSVVAESVAPAKPVATRPAPVSGGRDMTDAQRSETRYRQALIALDEGRVSTAFEQLEQALKLNPRHDAARQTLVTLHIEAGRNDEAMALLEQGLAIDAGQPALAMLLARMQIERGQSGVATLQRTLPAASGNADYHAFLAGALQREQRHKEAIEQYVLALRSAPDNGVWLMGLGISLQADKRNADALTAFQRAKASGTLTAPLQNFVDRRIEQLKS